MDNKSSAEIITDLIENASRPLIVGGAVYKERRMNVNLNDEAIEALLTARKELLCKNSKVQEYTCEVSTRYGFGVDRCLEAEVVGLNNEGIKTIGCCCGNHADSKGNAYIQVIPKDISKMKELGYEQLPLDESGNGQWCFKPRSILKDLVQQAREGNVYG
jgi:hypothetical protein